MKFAAILQLVALSILCTLGACDDGFSASGGPARSPTGLASRGASIVSARFAMLRSALEKRVRTTATVRLRFNYTPLVLHSFARLLQPSVPGGNVLLPAERLVLPFLVPNAFRLLDFTRTGRMTGLALVAAAAWDADHAPPTQPPRCFVAPGTILFAESVRQHIALAVTVEVIDGQNPFADFEPGREGDTIIAAVPGTVPGAPYVGRSLSQAIQQRIMDNIYWERVQIERTDGTGRAILSWYLAEIRDSDNNNCPQAPISLSAFTPAPIGNQPPLPSLDDDYCQQNGCSTFNFHTSS